MRHLGRIIHQGPRRIALLGGIVLLPAVALGLLAFRTFQGEQVRGEYQRRERQQQILRLLESDLSNWILSRCGEVEKDAFAFEVRQNRILLPRLNVYLSADHQRATAPELLARDANLWRAAQAVEFRGGETAATIQNYRRLLSGNPAVSSWSKLALLRLALLRTGSGDTAVWLKEIQDTDQAAMTESGIPVRVAAALLLIEHNGAATLPETGGFLSRTLSQLASGCWIPPRIFVPQLLQPPASWSLLPEPFLRCLSWMRAWSGAGISPLRHACSPASNAWLSSFPERTGIQAVCSKAPNWPVKLKPGWPH
jgi:hypothetical protein